jgi:ABC-type branched-subunit amino acid transport system permease subunit
VITGSEQTPRPATRARALLSSRVRSPRIRPGGSRARGIWALPAVLAVAIAFPFIWATDAYNLQLAGDALALGTWVMGLDILVGYTGLVSFGHAAWLAVGAYAFGYLAQRGWDAVPAIAVTVAIAALLSWLMGIVATRAGGLAFAIITLAQGVVLYTLILHLGFLGGGIGLFGVPLPKIAGLSLLGGERSLYFFALALACVSYLVLRSLVASPVGGFWRAIRDDRVRAQSIGIELQRYEVAAFVVAAVIGAVGGVAFVALNAGIGPSQFDWSQSGLALVILIVGGSCTIYGAVIGAIIYVFASSYLTSSFASTWQVYFGALFVALVLLTPGGVAGVIRLAAGRLQRRPA